jgi:putative DNA primase/helicase
VDGALLLAELAAFIARHVFLPDSAADAIAVWALHSYRFNAFRHTPRLAFTSPEKRCGKTTALDALALLACGPLSTANITSAALFRTIELAAPTLLIDEADTFLRDNDDLRGAINAGHKRDGQVIRCVGDDAEPRGFNVFAPVAIAAIGRLPPTIADRSINVRMRRATRAERKEPLDRPAEATGRCLASKCERWSQDHGAALEEADPKLPAALFNRAADNWRPLFAIAERVGGGWWERLEAASAVLMPVDDSEGLGVRLLADIKAVFAAFNMDRIGSQDLTERLVAIEDAPWPELNRGKALTQTKLAELLKQFSIYPGSVRLATGKTPKGYKLVDFEDAWARYLGEPSSAPPHRHKPQKPGACGLSEPQHEDVDVAASNHENLRKNGHRGGVADHTQEAGGWV